MGAEDHCHSREREHGQQRSLHSHSEIPHKWQWLSTADMVAAPVLHPGAGLSTWVVVRFYPSQPSHNSSSPFSDTSCCRRHPGLRQPLPMLAEGTTRFTLQPPHSQRSPSHQPRDSNSHTQDECLFRVNICRQTGIFPSPHIVNSLFL